MSAVVDKVESALDVLDDVTDILVEEVIDFVEDTIETLWEDLLEPIIEFLLSLFCIEDEDVTYATVYSTRILDDDDANILNKVALLHQQAPDSSIISNLTKTTAKYTSRFNAFYDYGESDYGTPTTTMRAMVPDTSDVKAAIDDDYGISCTVTNVEVSVPDDDEYVAWYFRETYDYVASDETLTYSGKEYEVADISYNESTDRYDVSIEDTEVTTITTTTTTDVVVTSYDSEYDLQTTTITTRVKVVGDESGDISDVTTVGDPVEEYVAIGTVVDSSTEEVEVSSGTNTIDTAILYAPSYDANRSVIAKYYTTDEDEWYYWVYEIGSGDYDSLNDSDSLYEVASMLPIVAIRIGTEDLEEGTDEYEKAKEALLKTGLYIDDMIEAYSENESIDNIEDVFVHFALDPNDTGDFESASKALFTTFYQIAEDTDLYVSEDSLSSTRGYYVASITQGAYNAAIMWKDPSVTTTEGTIGSIDTYEHEIEDDTTLIMRWQATEDQYITVQVENLSSITMIDRGGVWGTVTSEASAEEEFSIPLAMFNLDALSPLEQAQVYNISLRVSFYAAEKVHYEYYETKAFASFLKFVAIVIFLFSFGEGITLSTFLLTVAATVAAAYAIQYVMEKYYEHEDNAGRRAAFAVVMMGASYYGSTYTMPNASGLAAAVTAFAQVSALHYSIQLEMVNDKTEELYDDIEELQEDAENLNDSGLSTEWLASYQYGKDATVLSAETTLYRASNSYQCDWDRLYDYDSLVGDFVDNSLAKGVV